MMSNKCKIVQDLLPNYIEKVTSEETNDFVEKHLNQCENCTKVYNEMKSNLDIDETYVDEGVEYMKKFNKQVKHLKTWKKVLIIIALIIAVILGIILYRYSILIKISNLHKKSNEIKNIHYTYESSDEIITEFWRKDNLIKTEITTSGEKRVAFWKNINSKETYMILYKDKKYLKGPDWYPTVGLPITDFYEDSIIEKIKFSINPSISLKTINYENKKCYQIKYKQEGIPFDRESIYEKDTGFLRYSSGLASKKQGQGWENTENKYKYEVNKVTDKDVEKPDLNQYEYIENTEITE